MDNSRAKTKVGDFILSLDASFNLFHVSRPDGRPIPKELMGKWTSVHDFKHIHDAVVARDTLRGRS